MDFDNFELFIDDEDESENKRMPDSISKDIDRTAFIEEITIHESSHMIFGLLQFKEDLGFIRPRSISVDFNDFSGNFKGCVSPYYDVENWLNAITWYKADRKRIWGRIFGLLAGYSSYKVFFEDSEYFVSLLNKENTELNYYRLEGLRIGKTTYMTITDDFSKISDALTWLEINDSEEKLEKIRITINIITGLMKQDAVREAILFVKQCLMDRRGKIIEGDEFYRLCEKLNGDLKHISLNKYIP